MEVAVNKADLENMFVGKKVKISSVYGSNYAPYPHETTGVCKAIHSIPIHVTPFDIELENGERYAFLPEQHDEKSCSGTQHGMVGRVRTIEVVD